MDFRYAPKTIEVCVLVLLTSPENFRSIGQAVLEILSGNPQYTIHNTQNIKGGLAVILNIGYLPETIQGIVQVLLTSLKNFMSIGKGVLEILSGHHPK